jgi:hypothetical protein
MTDEQIKQIAAITILNSRIIGGLATGYTFLIEQVLPILPEKEGALRLRSEMEQLQAATQNLNIAIDSARKGLGLE